MIINLQQQIRNLENVEIGSRGKFLSDILINRKNSIERHRLEEICRQAIEGSIDVTEEESLIIRDVVEVSQYSVYIINNILDSFE